MKCRSGCPGNRAQTSAGQPVWPRSSIVPTRVSFASLQAPFEEAALRTKNASFGLQPAARGSQHVADVPGWRDLEQQDPRARFDGCPISTHFTAEERRHRRALGAFHLPYHHRGNWQADTRRRRSAMTSPSRRMCAGQAAEGVVHGFQHAKPADVSGIPDIRQPDRIRSTGERVRFR